MDLAKVDYLKRTIERHIRMHFHIDAVEAYCNSEILWIEWDKVDLIKNPGNGIIIIPLLDNSAVNSYDLKSWEVDFRGTKLILWGRLPTPSDLWTIDSVDTPLWYSNGKGVFLAAWDLAGVLFDLLTTKEESSSCMRDKHGRFVGEMSPRRMKDLLTVPIFNNAAALLVDRCMKIQAPYVYEQIPFSKPINLCLSHDLDQLRGNDLWTQLSRVGRMIRPVVKFKLPRLSPLKFILMNALFPRRFFMDDLLGMIEVEKEFGYRSTQYVLCGRKGRYGARTASKYFRRYLSEIPNGWPIGMHYNYNTHLQKNTFLEQKKDIESMTGLPVNSGRAHYLRMESKLSFDFWSQMGISFDESLGYPDRLGYRAGIAGPYFPFDVETHRELPILSIPLIAMDSCLGDKFGDAAVLEVEKLIAHLDVVGGTFTLLFHPGRFDNAEFPSTQKMYRLLLELFQRYNANCFTPNELRQNYKCPKIT